MYLEDRRVAGSRLLRLFEAQPASMAAEGSPPKSFLQRKASVLAGRNTFLEEEFDSREL
jgi:hypothetical protein